MQNIVRDIKGIFDLKFISRTEVSKYKNCRHPRRGGGGYLHKKVGGGYLGGHIPNSD